MFFFSYFSVTIESWMLQIIKYKIRMFNQKLQWNILYSKHTVLIYCFVPPIFSTPVHQIIERPLKHTFRFNYPFLNEGSSRHLNSCHNVSKWFVWSVPSVHLFKNEFIFNLKRFGISRDYTRTRTSEINF